MAKLHSYYVAGGIEELNYPEENMDDNLFIEVVNKSIGELDLVEEEANNINNIEDENSWIEESEEEMEEEEEVAVEEPEENNIVDDGEIIERYIDIDNQELRELLNVEVRVVIEPPEQLLFESDDEIDIENVLDKHFS